jgi:hypothetical protein
MLMHKVIATCMRTNKGIACYGFAAGKMHSKWIY